MSVRIQGVRVLNHCTAILTFLCIIRLDKGFPLHRDATQRKRFPLNRPFVRIIHWSAVDSHQKGSVTWTLIFYVSLNKELNKALNCWWFETSWKPLWRHCNMVPSHYLGQNWRIIQILYSTPSDVLVKSIYFRSSKGSWIRACTWRHLGRRCAGIK